MDDSSKLNLKEQLNKVISTTSHLPPPCPETQVITPKSYAEAVSTKLDSGATKMYRLEKDTHILQNPVAISNGPRVNFPDRERHQPSKVLYHYKAFQQKQHKQWYYRDYRLLVLLESDHWLTMVVKLHFENLMLL